MKHLKKIMSLILTAIMVIAMCVPVMAANGTGTITMSGSDNSHTYSIYQILIGDYAGGKLSNVKWGSATDKSGTNVTDTELAAFTALSNNAQATADAVNAYVKNNAVATDTIVGNGSAIVPTGYYVIRDSYIDQDVAQSVSTHIVKVVGDVTVTPKVGVPTSDKKVDDKNDSNTNENNVEWKDSADYDIGDAVPFRLHGTLPENFNSYSSYKYIFHDTESAGLTFNADSVVVKVDNIIVPEANNYEVIYPATHNDNTNCTFEVKFNNLKALKGDDGNDITVTNSSNIYVYYTSTLNTNAVIGSAGNPNEMYLEYSNNPNAGGEGDTDKTPKDKVIVFTYKVVANKTDGNTALTGAAFELFKKVVTVDATGQTSEAWVSRGKVGLNSDGKSDNTTTTFEWAGLDDGDYKIVEILTPSGYNTIADQYFTVTATHDLDSDNPTLTNLSGNTTTGEIIFTPNKNQGSLTADVVNKQGSQLPETGGIGTTIFYVVGVVLMLGAGVLLITKRRMSAKH